MDKLERESNLLTKLRTFQRRTSLSQSPIDQTRRRRRSPPRLPRLLVLPLFVLFLPHLLPELRCLNPLRKCFSSQYTYEIQSDPATAAFPSCGSSTSAYCCSQSRYPGSVRTSTAVHSASSSTATVYTAAFPTAAATTSASVHSTSLPASGSLPSSASSSAAYLQSTSSIHSSCSGPSSYSGSHDPSSSAAFRQHSEPQDWTVSFFNLLHLNTDYWPYSSLVYSFRYCGHC